MKILGYSLIAVSTLLFGSMLLPRCNCRVSAARLEAAKVQIDAFTSALSAFKQDVGDYPAGGSGVFALVDMTSDASGWRGPYLDGMPNDPWGRPYIYEYPGTHNTDRFDISSAGSDGKAGTEDDVTNWVASK